MNLKNIIKRMFPSLVDFRNRLYNRRSHARYQGKQIGDVFTDIYRSNHWNEKESASGTGSSQLQTAQVKEIITQVFREHKIKSVLDAPCGDFNWMREIDMQGMSYQGMDIVKEIIDNNNQHYRSGQIEFFTGDLTSTKLPDVDLLICRDCLVHLSYADIRKALNNIQSSKIKFLLTTTFTDHRNHDIVTGNWRPINLQQQPFQNSVPLAVYSEHCTEDERYKDKSLALWRVADMEPRQ